MDTLIEETQLPLQACIIWMHGLGADAHDMKGLARELPLRAGIRHVFINAPIRPVTLNNHMMMRAWYDIVGMSLTEREDHGGILQSEKMIMEVVAKQMENGFTSDQIFLAGFSQGGAMALYTGLRSKLPLAGIIALSAYLPLASQCEPLLKQETPIFIANGQHDSVVLPAWSQQSLAWVRAHGFTHVSHHEYPMAHAVCIEELRDLAVWLSQLILVDEEV